MNKLEELKEDELIKVEKFSLDGKSFMARFCKIYDGDTCKAVFSYKNEINRWDCRISGIDTPELRTKNPKEKEHAVKARDHLREMITGKTLKINCRKNDKYGRLLIDIITENGKTVSEILIEKGLAKEYHGGKKEKWVFE